MDSRTFLMTGRNGSAAPATDYTKTFNLPISIERNFSVPFYAELFNLSKDTIVRWFKDMPGVLKLGTVARRGRRTRVELRIPFSLAMKVYGERSK